MSCRAYVIVLGRGEGRGGGGGRGEGGGGGGRGWGEGGGGGGGVMVMVTFVGLVSKCLAVDQKSLVRIPPVASLVKCVLYPSSTWETSLRLKRAWW